MKKIILSVVALVGSASYGQDILQTIATETCSCIKDKKLDMEKVTGIQLENEFAGCFFNSYNAHLDEVEKVEKLDFSDEEQMGKFGEKVAMKMLGICPDVILAMGRADEEGATETVAIQTVEGEVIDIRTTDFVTIVLKDKNGRTHNLLLLNYFETSSLFTDNQIKKKDKIAVAYSEIDMYDPKAKEFRYYKVISGLEKK
jgi:hypothetical protein